MHRGADRILIGGQACDPLPDFRGLAARQLGIAAFGFDVTKDGVRGLDGKAAAGAAGERPQRRYRGSKLLILEPRR